MDVVFLIGRILFAVPFWKEEDAQAQQTQMAQFVKNVSMAGGALVIFYVYNQLQGVAGLSITNPLFDRAD